MLPWEEMMRKVGLQCHPPEMEEQDRKAGQVRFLVTEEAAGKCTLY